MDKLIDILAVDSLRQFQSYRDSSSNEPTSQPLELVLIIESAWFSNIFKMHLKLLFLFIMMVMTNLKENLLQGSGLPEVFITLTLLFWIIVSVVALYYSHYVYAIIRFQLIDASTLHFF